jgi:hypothetical protein
MWCQRCGTYCESGCIAVIMERKSVDAFCWGLSASPNCACDAFLMFSTPYSLCTGSAGAATTRGAIAGQRDASAGRARQQCHASPAGCQRAAVGRGKSRAIGKVERQYSNCTDQFDYVIYNIEASDDRSSQYLASFVVISRLGSVT